MSSSSDPACRATSKACGPSPCGSGPRILLSFWIQRTDSISLSSFSSVAGMLLDLSRPRRLATALSVPAINRVAVAWSFPASRMSVTCLGTIEVSLLPTSRSPAFLSMRLGK